MLLPVSARTAFHAHNGRRHLIVRGKHGERSDVYCLPLYGRLH